MRFALPEIYRVPQMFHWIVIVTLLVNASGTKSLDAEQGQSSKSQAVFHHPSPPNLFIPVFLPLRMKMYCNSSVTTEHK